jgi:hypothetical protein
MPDRAAVLRSQGVSEGKTVSDRIHALITKAMDLFSLSAKPEGILSEVPVQEFKTIYTGEGRNEEDTPLEHIFPRADRLALFALTMGSEVSAAVEERFKNNDFALGWMLDSVASLAADNSVQACERSYFDNLSKTGVTSPDRCVLSYSPGYCGWHISGQKKLFQFLEPQKLGITLNDSFLMTPLKSVTGVLVAGEKAIHIFDSNYPFCRFCKTHSCQRRMKDLLST